MRNREGKKNVTAVEKIKLLDRQIIALGDRIFERFTRLKNIHEATPPPREALDFRTVPAPALSAIDRALGAPVPPARETLASELRSSYAKAVEGRFHEQERLSAQKTERQKREQQEQQLEDKSLERSIFSVPVGAAIRGIWNRGTSEIRSEEKPQPIHFRDSAQTIPERYRVVVIDLSNYEPYQSMFHSIEKLNSLATSHFSSVRPQEGAPHILQPIDIQLSLTWQLRANIRKYQKPKFLAQANENLSELVKELDRKLRERIALIEDHGEVQDGPDAGGSIRA